MHSPWPPRIPCSLNTNRAPIAVACHSSSIEYLSALHNGFQKYLRCENTLEMARDQVRTLLHDRVSIAFPLGRAGISVATLAARILYPTNSIPELHLNCSQCDHTVLITCN